MTYKIQCSNDSCPENHRCGRFMQEPGPDQQYERFQWRYTKDKSRDTRQIVFGCQSFYSMPDKVLNAEVD